MFNIAVILAGCGRMDGSEVHESTLALLYLAKGGASYQCFAPDEPQARVANHVTGETVAGESRNQMIEAGRIARGAIRPLSEARPEDFDGLVMPGGSGSFANLSRGEHDVHPDVRRMLEGMADAGKPIAAICIAPMLVSRVLGGRGIRLTIGNNPEDAARIEATGARHVECAVEGCVVDMEHKIVSTPAYMLGPGIADVAAGIERCMGEFLSLCGRG